MSEIIFDCCGECIYKGFRIVHARELLVPGPWARASMQAKVRRHREYHDYYYVIKDNWISEKADNLKILVDAIDKIEREMKGKTKM